MSDTETPSSADLDKLPEKALRTLFLTLFLRGRSSRGLNKKSAPKSIGGKLSMTLLFYTAFGLFAFVFHNQPIFSLSIYLHSMTFVFLGMFVASSSGEVLFNKEEADILLHRPISPRTLLWAKIRVLVDVSLWLAFAFNLAGFIIGAATGDGNWLFLPVHAVSLAMEAVFCTGCVVLMYQLCLRWFGRERLDGFLTFSQVLISVAAVICGQVLPQMVIRSNQLLSVGESSKWIALIPPAWFAGIDDALAGSNSTRAWQLAGVAVVATTVVLWLAFGQLARDFGAGMQRLGEGTTAPARKRATRRWIDTVVDLPLFSWWFRDPVVRASFLLTSAYIFRDRDTKLRLYPAMAPLLLFPIIFLVRGFGGSNSGGNTFGTAFATGYLGVVPLQALSILQYSQQWQAADIFRAVPIHGPARICQGARGAVLCFMTVPIILAFTAVTWFTFHDVTKFALLLPGIIFLPVMGLVPNLGGRGVPLSLPTEEAKSSGRGMVMVGAMTGSAALSGLAAWAWSSGWFQWLIGVEIALVTVVYFRMRHSLARARWPSAE